MAKARGKTKKAILAIAEIEKIVGQALSCIDTSQQFKIRSYLEMAIEKCQDARDGFDQM